MKLKLGNQFWPWNVNRTSIEIRKDPSIDQDRWKTDQFDNYRITISTVKWTPLTLIKLSKQCLHLLGSLMKRWHQAWCLSRPFTPCESSETASLSWLSLLPRPVTAHRFIDLPSGWQTNRAVCPNAENFTVKASLWKASLWKASLYARRTIEKLLFTLCVYLSEGHCRGVHVRCATL